MQIILEKCPICYASLWEDLDHFRRVEYWYAKDRLPLGERVGFKVCKECGFVTYDYQDIETLSHLYDMQRQNMQAMNVITCNRKNTYHRMYLNDILSNAKKDFTVLDYGCAQGAVLNMIHTEYGIPKENLYGTEWSRAFRNFGRQEYGLNITKDIDTSKKYDLIILYHVLEHLQWPDTELEKLKGLLKPGGTIYIAVPEYMNLLDDASGLPIETFENIWHLNHVNCFTKTSFQNLLAKCALSHTEINDRTYGMTTLCRIDGKRGIVKEDYKEKIDIIQRQQTALQLLAEKKFDDAIAAYPKFPDAYLYKALQFENLKKFDEQILVLTAGQKACGEFTGNHKMEMSLARLHYQFDENTPEKRGYYGNNIKKAEQILTECIRYKPGNDDAFYMLSLINFFYKQDVPMAVEYMKHVARINPLRWAECYNMIGSMWAKYEG